MIMLVDDEMMALSMPIPLVETVKVLNAQPWSRIRPDGMAEMLYEIF